MSEYNINRILNLYYRKFPYKIKIYLPGISTLRSKPTILDLLKLYFHIDSKTKISVFPSRKLENHWGQIFDRGWWGNNLDDSFLINFKTITYFYKKLCELNSDEYYFRIEEPGANIYFVDEMISLLFLHNFENIITDYYMPKSKDVLKFIKNIKKYQICVNNLPHNGYCYRVHIDFSNINKLSNYRRRKFKNWIDIINLDDQKIKLTPTLISYLGEKNWFCSSTYFHVKDEEHLAMCHLYLGDVIKSVDEFVLYNKSKKCIKH